MSEHGRFPGWLRRGSLRRGLLAAGLLGLGLLGCLDRREPDGVEVRDECTICHGGQLDPPFEVAPPYSLAGDTEASARGVGAHEAHLTPTTWARAIACEECHVVPSEVDEQGHMDTPYPAEIIFSGPALAFEAEPWFDAEAGSCKDTFCHGGYFVGGRPSGGTTPQPSWTSEDAAVAACDGCHGMPPPDPHPATEACSDCHKNVRDDRSFSRPDLHVNGVVNFNIPAD